jgi:hypothetical protein
MTIREGDTVSEKKPPQREIPDLPLPEADADVKGGAGTYIGETEKNLGASFTEAKRLNANLLFNEGDSLFKR